MFQLDDETSEVVLEADRSSNNQLSVKPGTINQVCSTHV